MTPHALIVGGTRGLGREIAELFLQRGYDVSVIGRKIIETTGADSARLHCESCDVTNLSSLETALKSIFSRNEKVNAIVLLQRLRDADNSWEAEIATSLSATKNVIEMTSEFFDDRGGKSIVLVSSIADTFISSSQPVAYHVAKAGLHQLARYYAVKLGPKGISVNCVAPATFVKTENMQYYASNVRLTELFGKIIPMGRMGTARDTANLVGFLCSPEASFITGQHITVDGGVSLISQEALARGLAEL